jgi:hypothetical protein
MILTWKRWALFSVIAILAFFACQFYAEKYLTNFVSGSTWEAERLTDLPGTFGKFNNLIQNVDSVTNLPWPVHVGIFSQEPRHFDLNQSQDIDAETLMGLAILGPDYEKTDHDHSSGECCQSPKEHKKHIADWFIKVANLSIERATDQKEKQKLEQFRLFVLSNPDVFDNGQLLPLWHATSIRWATTQGTNENKVPAFWEQVAVHDGMSRNLIYAYYRFYPELKAIQYHVDVANKASVLPSKQLTGIFSLPKNVSAVSLANKILFSIQVMSMPVFDKLYLYNTSRMQYVSKGLKYYSDQQVVFRTLTGNDLAKQAFTSHLEQMRDMVARLCFLGDQLIAEGENQKALSIYRLAYTIGEQMMIADGIGASYLQIEMGRTLTSGVAEHLMEFWARQGNVEKTIRAKALLDGNQILIKQEIEKLRQKGSDPLGYNEPAYEIYARSASLTWWLGTTGIVFAVASLISSGVFVLLMRGQTLRKDEKLDISYKLLEIGFGVPIFLMVLLTMIFPLELLDVYTTGALLTWMWLFILLWLIFVGLLALFSGAENEGIRRSPGRRIWIFTALGVAAGCLVASIISTEMMPMIAVGIAVVITGIGFFIWLVVTLFTWLIQRSFEDRRSRARANLAFSVCAMLASAVFLIASLASMPLTRYHQDRYFNLAMADAVNETGYFLGDNWPVTFKGLPAELFSLEQATKPASPAQQ